MSNVNATLKCSIMNTMQSETADFAPVPPSGELEETSALSLILACSLHYVKHEFICKIGST